MAERIASSLTSLVVLSQCVDGGGEVDVERDTEEVVLLLLLLMWCSFLLSFEVTAADYILFSAHSLFFYYFPAVQNLLFVVSCSLFELVIAFTLVFASSLQV